MFDLRSMRVWQRILFGIAALTLLIPALSTPAGAQDPDDGGDAPDINLQILAFNDYHGHVGPGASGSVDGADAGGGEYLSAKLSELRAGNSNTFTVAAGDLIGASPALSGLFHDEPSVESLNVMGLNVSSVGNHEFDEGVVELLRMQNGGCHPVEGCYFPAEPYAGAEFQWLAANTVDALGETPLPEYWIETFDGVQVAFIGMTLEATPSLVAASGIVGYDFLDEAETANALVPELTAQGVEAIVVLLHEGGSQTPPPGAFDACAGISGPIVAIHDALDPEIDALITGHTHLPYNCRLDDPDGQPRIVTSAYSFGRVVSELQLVLDGDTGDVDRELSIATNHVVDQASLAPDPAVSAVLAKWQPLVDGLANDPIGSITTDINRGGIAGSDRGVESPAGNLVADAQAWATAVNGADLALMNPGGVRSDLLFDESAVGEGDGVVTYGEAFTFQPFGNTLVTIPMTGEQIISVLLEQCQPAGTSRPFLHLGVSDGFTYDLETTITANGCESVTVSDARLNGQLLETSQIYQVTVNNFLADGGDNFTTFATIDPALRFIGGNDLEALVSYLTANSPVAPPSTDRVNEFIAPPTPTPTPPPPTPEPTATPAPPTPTATPAPPTPTPPPPTPEPTATPVPTPQPTPTTGPTPPPTPSPTPTTVPNVPTCRGLPATIQGSGFVVGTSGDDVIVTGNRSDVILGLGGDDTICSGAGNDIVLAGKGDDRVSAGRGNDFVSGGRGDDNLRGGSGRDTLVGDRGFDVCSGGTGRDSFYRCERIRDRW